MAQVHAESSMYMPFPQLLFLSLGDAVNCALCNINIAPDRTFCSVRCKMIIQHRNPEYRSKMTQVHSKWMSVYMKSKWKDATYRNNKVAQIKSQAQNEDSGFGAKSLWKHQRAKMLLANSGKVVYLLGTMNKLESKFNDLFSGSTTYASGKFWKTLHNNDRITPDFKVNGQDKVIEIFGNYWHTKENEKFRISQWKSVGLKCLVIWEKDLHEKTNKQIQRTIKFIAKPESQSENVCIC